jgi:hypothetical protein
MWKRRLRLDLQKCGALAHVTPWRVSIHLAVTHEPFLGWILEGRKTIESRFSVRKISPYRRVSVDDVLIFKQPSAFIVGAATVSAVEDIDLDEEILKQIRTQYAVPLCAHDDQFWLRRCRARYATLLHLTDVRRLKPFSCGKRDRSAWVTLPRIEEGTCTDDLS